MNPAPGLSTDRLDLTINLAKQIIVLAESPLEPRILEHSKTHLFNVLGLAMSAVEHPAVTQVLRLGSLVGPPGHAAVPGRSGTLDPQYAAFASGIAAHVDDFDDTHLATIIHPSATSMAATIALGTTRGADGPTVLRAFALGCEAQLRVGLSMSPSHYTAGWHITGTCGVIGAAVSAGLTIGLDSHRLAQAIGIASSMTVGQREGFGTMLKSLHAGRAAANGVLAALLAERGFTGSMRGLEAPRGMISVLSESEDPGAVLRGLGSNWTFLDDLVKPYPCGIVIHPLIDAGIRLAQEVGVPSEVRSLKVLCHPLVGDLTGVVHPTDRLQARFSAVHGLAAALVAGEFSLTTLSQDVIDDPQVARLRDIAELEFERDRSRDSAIVTVELADDRVITAEVEHARGSQEQPMREEELFAKVESLVGLRSAQDLREAVEDLEPAKDLNRLARAMSPTEDTINGD